MAALRVLFVVAGRLTSFTRQGRALVEETSFACDGAGRAAFAAYLAQHRGSSFHLLAELADEGFHAEDIPHLTGRDRAAVVARKLGQHFYGTPYVAALGQGRRREGRRDERVLFAALTRPQAVEPWLEAIRQAQALLVGVFSAPQAIAVLAAAPARNHRHLLLTTLTRGGLRQSYFGDGQLRFSRLTPALADVPEQASAACTGAAAQLRQYLTGQRLLDHDTPLTVLILVHPAQIEHFRRHCADSDALRYEIFDLATACRRHGLASIPPDSRCDVLLAHLILRRTPRVQFAPAAALRRRRLQQVRRTLHSAGIAALAAGLLLAGKLLLDAQPWAQTTERLRLESERYKREAQAARQMLPTASLPAAGLLPLVDRYEALLKASLGPAPLYRHLGAALDRYPQIELDRLEWRSADRTDGDRVDVYATLPQPLANHPRSQVAIIEGFAAQLRANRGIRVHALSLPSDTTAGRILRNDDGGTDAAAPTFALGVVQELRP